MKRGRIGPKAERKTFRAAEAFYGLASPTGQPHTVFPPEAERVKREKPNARPDAPLEKDVQSSVLAAIRAHPKVAWCGRINSGTAVAQNVNGSARYTRFHTINGMSDLLGQMKDGRMLALEIKRDHHGRPTEDQAAFLAKVKENNGVAGWCYSIDGAYEILDNAS